MPARIEYRWSAEEDETLIGLWSKGLSASEIAREMGKTSRSSILGRVHRLKLPLRTKGASRQARNRIAVGKLIGSINRIRSAMKPKQPKAKSSPVRELLRDLPTEPLPPVDTMPAQVSFNGLEPHHCRAIVAEHLPFDGDRKIYCGERKVLGQQYCPEHCRRYFQPPKVQAGANVPGKHFGGLIGRVISSEIGSMKTAEEFLKA